MIRVMIVDDSPLVRKIAGDILEADPDMKVVATAATAEFALHKLGREAPDVVTMDIEMPGIGGLEAIRRIMATRPTPVVVLSSYVRSGAEYTLRALEAGALDFVLKPQATLSGGIEQVAKELREKVRNAGQVHFPTPDPNHGATDPTVTPAQSAAKDYGLQSSLGALAARLEGGCAEVVGVGTSTGGPVALRMLLEGLPGDFPVPIVIVQHMPPVFTRAFAERLNACSPLEVKEAQDGDLLLPGRALIAPGDFHLSVVRANGEARVVLERGAAVSGHRPSIDVLMHSLAGEYGRSAVAVIMTGMGKDGAAGIRRLHAAGGAVIAQDEQSSVIFGMNREVVANGDADAVLPLDRIGETLLRLVATSRTSSAVHRPGG